MLASSKHKYSKTLAFPDTYYELIINVLQSVELFCAYLIRKSYAYFVMNINMIQQAINDNYKIIYSSYGEKNIKKQMGYMIENYACVMPKN